MIAQVHVWIEGKVQGVFYRDWVRQEAEALHIVGWVRNISDGRVEAVFEGEREAVDALIEQCWEGPPHAHVTHIERSEKLATREFHGFSIR